jgi:hypothetical protein
MGKMHAKIAKRKFDAFYCKLLTLKLLIIMLYANEPATMAIVTGNRNKTINDGYAMK